MAALPPATAAERTIDWVEDARLAEAKRAQRAEDEEVSALLFAISNLEGAAQNAEDEGRADRASKLRAKARLMLADPLLARSARKVSVGR